MTLVGAVDDRTSVLRRFLAVSFPAGTAAVRESYLEQLNGRGARSQPAGAAVFAGIVGQALDMRLKLACARPAVPAGVASGIDLVTQIAHRSRARATDDATRSSAHRWAEISEVGQELADQIVAAATELELDDRRSQLARRRNQETSLARLLLTAAWFEIAYRNLPSFLHTPVLTAPDAPLRLRALLRRVPQPAVNDMLHLVSGAAAGPFAALRTGADTAVAGPTFTGSFAVGNAEGDLIVDQLLLDVKTTRSPERFRSTLVWQLLGYALLDFDDHHHIDEIGIYLARVPTLIRWPLPDLIEQLGADTDLAGLRRRLRQLGSTLVLHGSMPVAGIDAAVAAVHFARAGVTSPGRCWLCDRELPESRRGGQRRYCTPGCRSLAARARRRGVPRNPIR